MISYNRNDKLQVMQHTPCRNTEVWWHDSDGATSAVIDDWRDTETGIFVFFGTYFLNEKGEAYRKKNGIYVNQCSGLQWQQYKEKGFKKKHIEPIWVSARYISYGYKLRDYRFERTFTLEESLALVKELIGKIEANKAASVVVQTNEG